MFAVVTIGGKQFKVSPGDTILVSRMGQKVGETVVFDPLLLSDGSRTTIGTPTVSGSKVKAKVVAHERGTKLEIRRFKSKVRERKKIGFRPDLTKLTIVSVA